VLGARGAPQGKQKKDKGKAKAGSGGAGGGPSNKAAAAGSSGQGSSGQGSSGQGSSRPNAPPGRIIGLSTEEPVVQAAEPASGSQQTQPQLAAGGVTKKDEERLRKERQRHRKIEEASEALDVAMARMAETAGARGVEAVEEAMQAAAKHDGRSEPLAALVAEARGMVEQARAVEAERARVAAEEAAAVATVAVEAERRARQAAEEVAAAAAEAVVEEAEAAERRQMEHELAALTVRSQQIQARLGVPAAAPAPQAEEELCVMCLDARKDHIILPCGHQCVCKGCAEQLTRTKTPTCPLCRRAIRETTRVFT
jgi:hypothetical protein